MTRQANTQNPLIFTVITSDGLEQATHLATLALERM
jgi:hypothetical protein